MPSSQTFTLRNPTPRGSDSQPQIESVNARLYVQVRPIALEPMAEVQVNLVSVCSMLPPHEVARLELAILGRIITECQDELSTILQSRSLKPNAKELTTNAASPASLSQPENQR